MARPIKRTFPCIISSLRRTSLVAHSHQHLSLSWRCYSRNCLHANSDTSSVLLTNQPLGNLQPRPCSSRFKSRPKMLESRKRLSLQRQPSSLSHQSWHLPLLFQRKISCSVVCLMTSSAA